MHRLAPLAALLLTTFSGPATNAGVTPGQEQEGSETPGRSLFLQHCSRCHGVEGGGGEGPSLARPRLRRAESDDDLATVIRRGIPDRGMPGTRHLVAADVSLLVGYVRSFGRVAVEPLSGDPQHGEDVYWEWDCEACHVLDGVGRHIGPELTTIGVQRGVAYLRESLIDPRASVPERYEFLRARPAEDPVVEGLLLNEDAFTIQLRDANGRFHSFEKAELAGLDRMGKRSIMRSYRGRLTTEELDDLVAFLATRRGEDDADEQDTSKDADNKGEER